MPAPAVRRPVVIGPRKCTNYDNCGKTIPVEKRSDAKFCSDRCRYDHWVRMNSNETDSE